jgi:hypothetical protein
VSHVRRTGYATRRWLGGDGGSTPQRPLTGCKTMSVTSSAADGDTRCARNCIATPCGRPAVALCRIHTPRGTLMCGTASAAATAAFAAHVAGYSFDGICVLYDVTSCFSATMRERQKMASIRSFDEYYGDLKMKRSTAETSNVHIHLLTRGTTSPSPLPSSLARQCVRLSVVVSILFRMT